MAAKIRYHVGDLPEPLSGVSSVAVDTEAMGLINRRDRLCVVQLSTGDGTADVVQIPRGHRQSPNLMQLMADPSVEKLFHFGRFDMGIIAAHYGVMPQPIYCTKIASKLVRTYTDRHGLKELARELIGEDLSKQQQSSDWGAETLTDAQLAYAASDVLYLHQIRDALTTMLQRENRLELARQVFATLPIRVALDLAGWDEIDIYAH